MPLREERRQLFAGRRRRVIGGIVAMRMCGSLVEVRRNSCYEDMDGRVSSD